MTFFDPSKSLIENIAFLSSPLLLIIGIIGLRQLQIAKKSLMITSARDAAKLSFEITEEYTKRFKQAFYDLMEAMEKYKIPELVIDIQDFSLEEYNKIDKKLREQWEANYDNASLEYIEMANLLEGYATYFIKKIADEDIAFNVDCYLYIQQTELCYPFIVKKHFDDKLNLYCCHTIQLYKLWKTRIEIMHNEKELKILHEKLKIKEKPNSVKPMGTE